MLRRTKELISEIRSVPRFFSTKHPNATRIALLQVFVYVILAIIGLMLGNTERFAQVGDALSGWMGVLAVIFGNWLLFAALTIQSGELGEQRSLRIQQIDCEYRARIDAALAELQDARSSGSIFDEMATLVARMVINGLADGGPNLADTPSGVDFTFDVASWSVLLDADHPTEKFPDVNLRAPACDVESALGALAAFERAASAIRVRHAFRRSCDLPDSIAADMQRFITSCSDDLRVKMTNYARVRSTWSKRPLGVFNSIAPDDADSSPFANPNRARRALALMEGIHATIGLLNQIRGHDAG